MECMFVDELRSSISLLMANLESVPITKDPKFPAAMRGARQRKQKQPGNKQRANAIGTRLYPRTPLNLALHSTTACTCRTQASTPARVATRSARCRSSTSSFRLNFIFVVDLLAVALVNFVMILITVTSN